MKYNTAKRVIGVEWKFLWNPIVANTIESRRSSGQRSDLILNIYSSCWAQKQSIELICCLKCRPSDQNKLQQLFNKKVISAHFDLKMESQSIEFSAASAFLGMAGKTDRIFWRNSLSCNREATRIKPQLQIIDYKWDAYETNVHCGHPGPSIRWCSEDQHHTRRRVNPSPALATLTKRHFLAPPRFPVFPEHVEMEKVVLFFFITVWTWE